MLQKLYLYIGFFAMRSLCLAQREPGGGSYIFQIATYNSHLSTSQYGRAGQCQNRLEEEKHQWKKDPLTEYAPGNSGSPDSISA